MSCPINGIGKGLINLELLLTWYFYPPTAFNFASILSQQLSFFMVTATSYIQMPIEIFQHREKAKNNKYQMKHKVDWPEQRSHSTISPLHFMAMVGWTANHLYWLCTLWLRPKEICFVIKIEIYKFRFTRMTGSSLPTFDTSSCPFHSQNNVGLLDSWHSACNLQPMQSEKAETNFGAPLRLKHKEEKPHTFITKVIGLCTSNIFA